MPDATIKEMMVFFGMTASEFTKAWKTLTDKDKKELKEGIGNSTFNY